MNATNGVLTPLAGSPFGLGGMFPIGYATDASGRLFSVNNEGNQVRAFTTSERRADGGRGQSVRRSGA